MRHYNRNTRNVPFLIFSCRTLNNFHKLLVIIVISNENKRNDHINNIMSKRRDKIYLLKTLQYFFQMQEKLKTCWNSTNLRNFRRLSFGDDVNVTFMSQQLVL